MSKQPYTIILNKENIERFGIYTVDGNYFVKPKRSYHYFKCKYCNKEFIRTGKHSPYCSQECYFNDISIKQKFDVIKESFEKEGYTLLSTICVDNTEKIDFICPNGHIHNISWANWSHSTQQQRCGLCAKNIAK
jgi:hypothetical protein